MSDDSTRRQELCVSSWQMAAARTKRPREGSFASVGCAITERLAPVVNDRLCLFDGSRDLTETRGVARRPQISPEDLWEASILYVWALGPACY
jgi:hypothetical protein